MIHLKFQDNESAHEDLFITTPNGTFGCDSYYFLIDPNVDPENESPAKVLIGLRSLLRQWLESIESASDVATLFLPYEFADEYTGCLKCEFDGPVVSITRVWSEIGAVFPSQIDELLHQLPSPSPYDDAKSFLVDRQGLIEAVRSNIQEMTTEDGSTI